MIDLRGRRTLVTGAALRIGGAIARCFARAGSEVVVHYRHSEEAAQELIQELLLLGDGHEAIRADLGVAAERDALIPTLLECGKPLDVLVNNASVYRRCALRELTAELWQEDYEINFAAPFQLMRQFARHCGRGSIVNILDQRVAGVDPAAGAYGLAKKSLRDATLAAAVEWAPEIRVNAVAPGIVLPPPGVSGAALPALAATIPMRRVSSVHEVAETCLFLTCAETITGQVLFVDGGLHLAGSDGRETGAAQAD